LGEEGRHPQRGEGRGKAKEERNNGKVELLKGKIAEGVEG
jgi:hypothetical protein